MIWFVKLTILLTVWFIKELECLVQQQDVRHDEVYTIDSMPINSCEWGNKNAKMPLTYKIKWKCNFGRTKCITIIQSVACLCVSFVHLTFPWIMCCSKYVCKKNFHIRILTLLTTLQPTFIILLFFLHLTYSYT